MMNIKSYVDFINRSMKWEHSRIFEEVELEESQQKSNKKLEDKFPELKVISNEFIKFEEDFTNDENGKKFNQMMDELEETEGFKAAMEVLRKNVVKNGLVKTLKMMKNSLVFLKGMVSYEKKIREILPDGEQYHVAGINTITGGEESVVEAALDKIKQALTAKNLMKILTGKTDSLELEYNTQKGSEASGEIKDVQIKDDGTIEVSIENDKVGTVKKDISEITSAGEGTEDSENKDLMKKLSDIKSKNPDYIAKILTFANFITSDNNAEAVEKIAKIVGF